MPRGPHPAGRHAAFSLGHGRGWRGGELGGAFAGFITLVGMVYPVMAQRLRAHGLRAGRLAAHGPQAGSPRPMRGT
jgi:hypothetical protein